GLPAADALEPARLGADVGGAGCLARRNRDGRRRALLQRGGQAAARVAPQPRVLPLELLHARAELGVLVPQLLQLPCPPDGARPEDHQCHQRRASHQPPRLTMASKAAFGIGMTLSRDWRTSGIVRSVLSALISSSVTGRSSFRTGARSTATQFPSFAVGSGYASRATSQMPITAGP